MFYFNFCQLSKDVNVDNEYYLKGHLTQCDGDDKEGDGDGVDLAQCVC